MVRSLKDHAGYLVVDHRDSPGLSAEEAARMEAELAKAGHARKIAFTSPRGEVTEFDVKQCSHCERTIALNAARVRDRGYCPKCDHYVCDACDAIREKTGDCVPMIKRMVEAHDRAQKFAGQPDHPDAQPRIVLTDA